MTPVPGGTVTVQGTDGPQQVEVGRFWIGKTEVTWDEYDVFLHRLDEDQEDAEADAVSRPSQPYTLPGENFGHQGHPALAMTREAAEAYCQWLSAKTGRTYRLPTRAEWTWACQGASAGNTAPQADALGEHAWYEANSERRTHPVAQLKPNALGLYDTLGNVAEWVAPTEDAAADESNVVMGGTFESEAEAVQCDAELEQTPMWNETDPQLPKSRWWLSDAPFVGFRVVCEPE